jgi:6-phosphogluconolactonase
MQNPTALLVFISMFAPEQDGGIRAFHLDTATGRLAPASMTRGVPHPFFLAVSPDEKTLYSIWAKNFGSQDDEEVAAWRIVDRDGTLAPLNRQSSRGPAACFLETDPAGRTLLLANYSNGSVASLPLAADGSLAAAASFVRNQAAGSGVHPRQDAPYAHAIIPGPAVAGSDGRPSGIRFAYSADLGTDQILCHRLDTATATLSANSPAFTKSPPGGGPRHLAFDPAGRRLYAMNELSNSVSVYDFDPVTGQLTERQTISTLPAGFTGTTKTADVKITPDGRFLYGTNRGHDSIAIYGIAADGRLSLVDIVTSHGAGPQNLAITPDGKLLLCANMPGNNVAVFRIDGSSGRLTLIGSPVEVTSPACIRILTKW